jgi:pimeloyl-ACP methyl ester carboxylesterase
MVPLLERAGHRVIAHDLPGLGRDITPLDQISLDYWTDYVHQIISVQPEPVILVGHSRAGVILSSVAEKSPNKIIQLVYVTAALVRDGESLRQLVVEDGTSSVLANRIVAADGKSVTVKEDALKDLFYGECSDEDVALARLLLRPEPTAPSDTPVHVTDEKFGTVPRFYIECLRDKAHPQSLQKKMYTALPCHKVMTLDTDHSPFFSAPQQLLECLLALNLQGGNVA